MVYGALAGVFTLGSGIWMQRTTAPTADVEAFVKKLRNTPKAFSDWELATEEQLPALHQRELQCHSYFLRNYVRAKTGERVHVSVLLGPQGPTSRHDPNDCYPGAGYEVVGTVQREMFKLGDKEVPLNTCVLKMPGSLDRRIKVIWGWNNGSGWAVPESEPRIFYAGSPFLFKVQMVTELDSLDKSRETVQKQFAEEFLTMFDKNLGIES